jgi:hypothetical protein
MNVLKHVQQLHTKMTFMCKWNRNVQFCSSNATKLSLLTSTGFDIDTYSLAFVVMRRVKKRILWQGEYLSNTNVDLNWDSISTFFLSRHYIYKKLQAIDQCGPWHTSYVVQRKLQTCLLSYLMQTHMISDTQSNHTEHLLGAAHIIHHWPTLIALKWLGGN